MSTIFALDSVLNKYVPVSADSPVLLNYASPRVGNYLFSAQVIVNVPRVFRVVRDGDPVVSIPPCSIIRACSNDLGLTSFPATLKELNEIYTKKNPAIDKNYWHTGGLVLYTNDMSKYKVCGNTLSENNPDAECTPKINVSVSDHTTYMDKSVSGVCQGARKYFRF